MDSSKRNKIRGSLLGGAAGDALGYAVEFGTLEHIRAKYGDKGITEYDLTNGKALISDDTQMTLFTANGILVCDVMSRIPGNRVSPEMFMPLSYRDWYKTQTYSFANAPKPGQQADGSGISWLLDIPELYSRRAPGSTCLSALSSPADSSPSDPIVHPVNNSKGCGGIMRTAPVGLCRSTDIKQLDYLGAQLSAITHGHSLGYMPGAVLTHVLNRIVYPVGWLSSLKEIVLEAKENVKELFAEDENTKILCDIIDNAVILSENSASDEENISRLGEGWVAEETLAIALYCALKYEHDFSSGIIAAVNHNGDSDSTGAVTGNILGAINGFDALDEKWIKHLELRDILLEIADDLAAMDEKSPDGEVFSPDIECKYLRMHRKEYREMLSFG